MLANDWSQTIILVADIVASRSASSKSSTSRHYYRPKILNRSLQKIVATTLVISRQAVGSAEVSSQLAMVEAIAGFNLAANIAQFAVIGLDLARKTKELLNSASGLLKEHEELRKVMTDLNALTKQIPANLAASSVIPKGLRELRDTCENLYGQLFQLLKKLEVQPGTKGRKRESFRKAAQAAWSKGKIKELETRLCRVRDEIPFHLIVTLRYVATILSLRKRYCCHELLRSRKACTLRSGFNC